LKDKQLSVADFPDHIQDLKERFIVRRQGRTKLYLPAHLVRRYSSNSKELIDVESEAIKAVHERKYYEQKQKNENVKKINRDQQKIDDDTLKELRKAGISKSGNNLNALNAIGNLPGSSMLSDYPVKSASDSHSSHANQNVPQWWIPNPDYKKSPDSHSDMAHAFKSSQNSISGGCANPKFLPEGDTNAKVITSQPHPQFINESHNKPQLMPTQYVEIPEDNPHNLEVHSLVQFGSPPCYGVIKWIGYLPEIDHTMGGVEVVCY